jgi:hypothetical protein
MAAKVSTVPEYLRAIASHDRVIVNAVRDLITANIAEGFIETVAWGFPTFQVPLDVATATFDGEPMVYAAIAAEKRRYALYLTPLYNDSPAELEFRTRWRSPSHRMVDLGAGCLRFRDLKDLDLALITEVVASMTVDEFVASYHRTKDT